MPKKEQDLEFLLDAMTSITGLSISAAHRPGVVLFLGLAQTQAEIVSEALRSEQVDDLELAPVFRADGTVKP